MSKEKLSDQPPEGSQEARDRHILELTGIQPPEHTHTPIGELRDLVRGVQAGDDEAALGLVATRLRWMYDYAQKEVVQGRFDLDVADIMQMASLATLEAARKINVESEAVNRILYSKTSYIMSGLMVQSKLVPDINEGGQKHTNARHGFQEERMVDRIVLAGGRADVAAMEDDSALPDIDPEFQAEQDLIHATLESSLDALGEEERYVIEARFGLGEFAGIPWTFAEIEDDTGMVSSQVWRLKARALEKIRGAFAENQLGHLVGIEVEEVPPGGTEQPRWTAEQLTLQREWLEEVKARREARLNQWLEEIAARRRSDEESLTSASA